MLGFTASIFILLWITDEASYEKMHKKADDIFLAYKTYSIGEESKVNPSLPMPFGPSAEEAFPEIENAVRVVRHPSVIRIKEENFIEQKFAAVDPGYFKIFTYSFMEGDPENVLGEPGNCIITKAIAEKYFGENTPIGQNITLNESEIFTVAGVVEDQVGNSMLDFEVFVPFTSIFKPGSEQDDWHYHFTDTYFYCPNGINQEQLNARLTRHIRSFMPEDKSISILTQRINQKYLHDLTANQPRIIYVYIFAAIGLLIIIIACINFTNSSTYVSIRRGKEIGVRKINGASKRHLIKHFFGEVLLQSIVSYFLAMAFVEIFQTRFNLLTDKEISIPWTAPYFIIISILIIVFTTFLAGVYPSILISAFKPIDAFRNKLNTGMGIVRFRTGLIIFQFAISSVLITATLSIYRQVNFMQQSDLGFEKENLLYLSYDKSMASSYQLFRNEMLGKEGIESVCRASSSPTESWNIVRGLTWEGKPDDETVGFAFISGDEDLVETLGIQMLAGRDYDRNYKTDSLKIIINEKAKDVLGFENPVGKYMLSDTTKLEILGLFNNFHALPMTYEIEPMIINFWEDFYSIVLIRLKSGNPEPYIEHIQKIWESLYPTIPFTYTFVDDKIEQQYKSEIRVGKLAGVFSILAIFITCIGLFSISGLMAQRRTQEIGIRKTMGASEKNVVILFTSQYLKWVIIANIIAWPIAFIFIKNWLKNFAYREEIGFWSFAAAMLLSVLISIITISWHTYGITKINPAETLKGD